MLLNMLITSQTYPSLMAKQPQEHCNGMSLWKRQRSHLHIGHKREHRQGQSQDFLTILCGELPHSLLRAELTIS
jgi:hypothetical protein